MLRLAATILCAVAALATDGARAQPAAPSGAVTVRGSTLLRDGDPWIPHGFVQIAFVAAPGVGDSKPVFRIASNHYTPTEYTDMRDAGADSVRIQVSQPGLDPQSSLFMVSFRDRVIGAIRAARSAGLSVIVSVQDESQSGEATPAALPNDATRRVWQELAPVFGHDRGVLFELLNEPRLHVSPQNWQDWADAMNQTILTVRRTGAVNVVVADGLQFAEQLDGAPHLQDPLGQVAYASHPYAHKAADQTPAAWAHKFGDFARTAPVIVTEWTTGIPYYCDGMTTPASVAPFLNTLQQLGVGLEVVTWDWSAPHFGSAIYGFPTATVSRFTGLSCRNAGFGPGAMVEEWYRTGVPPASAE